MGFLLDFFGGIYFKLGLIAIIAVGALYIHDLRGQVEIAEQNAKTYEASYKGEQQKNATLGASITQLQTINGNLANSFSDLQREKNEQEVRLQAQIRSLSKQAEIDPKGVELKINQGTKNALRCDELVTGAPLTEAEKAPESRNPLCQSYLDKRKKQ